MNMKKALLLFCPIIMYASCFDVTDDEFSGDSGCLIDYVAPELMPYDSITCIEYNGNLYPDYDSLLGYYEIEVTIMDTDLMVKRDHLNVQRIKVDNDTNKWDFFELCGKHRGDTEWEQIFCKPRIPPYPYHIDSTYYLSLEILDLIGREIESRQFYFDSEDWESAIHYFPDCLRRLNFNITMRGEVFINVPSVTQ